MSFVQTLWARTIVRALGDGGVRAIVVSPGSRSTPLAAALPGAAGPGDASAQRARAWGISQEPAQPASCGANDDLDVHVVVDERAAGFFALGLARAGGAPVALLCTSGTAPAHYYPAVIEAAMAEVPLVVVSADRPPEMHGGGAAQTIDQTRLFGGHVRAFVDLGPPTGDELAIRSARRRVVQAVLAARSPRPGPVQINVPLGKPLEPTAPSSEEDRALAARIAALSTTVAPPGPPRAADAAITALAAALGRARRPIVVAGPRGLDPARDLAVANAVSALATRHGAAVLAETTSQLRGALAPEVARLDRFDLVLAARGLDCDLIVQVGAEPVAAAWPSFLAAKRDVPRWVVAEHPWPDPHSSAAGVVLGDVADALARASAGADARADATWLSEIRTLDRRAAEVVAGLVKAPDSEGAALAAALDGAGDALVVLGNSLPVRVADHVFSGRRRVLSQRGASGIDGLIAGAAGASTTGPVVAIIGDVTFAHDAGSLALLRKRPVTLVVIDNRGGRIFESLPVKHAVSDDDFARLWLTAPDLDVVAIARGFGIAAETVRNPDDLRAAVAARRTTVLHVPVAPSSARELRSKAIEELS